MRAADEQGEQAQMAEQQAQQAQQQQMSAALEQAGIHGNDQLSDGERQMGIIGHDDKQRFVQHHDGAFRSMVNFPNLLEAGLTAEQWIADVRGKKPAVSVKQWVEMGGHKAQYSGYQQVRNHFIQAGDDHGSPIFGFIADDSRRSESAKLMKKIRATKDERKRGRLRKQFASAYPELHPYIVQA